MKKSDPGLWSDFSFCLKNAFLIIYFIRFILHQDGMQITSLSFIKSASKVSECPQESLPEIAVIGRSNVGKSSLINFLMGKTIAKASDKPWKTQLINYFLVNESRYFVDLPGYGYAKASLESRRAWIDKTYDYFLERKPFIFVLIDGSISPQKIDLEFIQALKEENLIFSLIITKTDKANQKTLHQNLKLLKQTLQKQIGVVPEIFLSSTVKKLGKEQILWAIEQRIITK